MKTLIFLSILFWTIASPVLGELTDADLDKIRLIVNDSEKRIRAEFKAEIAAVKQDIEEDIAAVKKELKEEIATVKQDLKEEIASSGKNMKEYTALQINGVEERLSTYGWLIYIFIPLIVAAIGIPATIMAWRFAKDNALEKQVEILTQEVETLKQQQTTSS